MGLPRRNSAPWCTRSSLRDSVTRGVPLKSLCIFLFIWSPGMGTNQSISPFTKLSTLKQLIINKHILNLGVLYNRSKWFKSSFLFFSQNRYHIFVYITIILEVRGQLHPVLRIRNDFIRIRIRILLFSRFRISILFRNRIQHEFFLIFLT
jgi:hypothetical protein